MTPQAWAITWLNAAGQAEDYVGSWLLVLLVAAGGVSLFSSMMRGRNS